MKKTISLITSILLLGVLVVSMLVGCTYHVPENHCIIALNRGYELYDANGDLCKRIEKEIDGVEQLWDFNYYSVVKGADYTILAHHMMSISFDYAYFGPGINGDIMVNAYWQGYVIKSLSKSYGENSGLQDEVIYTTNFKDTSASIKVSFSENCKILADYQNFLVVGGILEVVEKGATPLGDINNYLNEDGSVKQKSDIYYLLLKDEVCVHQDAWQTNLEIIGYDYHSIKDYGVAIQANFTANPLAVSDNEEVFLHTICRTYDGEYFIGSTELADAQGFILPVREHELKLTFKK